ncbi:hypothetical protein [Chamaesiphon polymorphus]|uniref:hypothetical protein n=1 Tax=Chamaesiphon polymorphus TaxID=2107691 RepID=UPI0015E6D7BC|nr:hypothetical protein [Chamaesiphon polymorphus]
MIQARYEDARSIVSILKRCQDCWVSLRSTQPTVFDMFHDRALRRGLFTVKIPIV